MCQLLAMNCNTPTDICFSFTGFQARGGLTDSHNDGWGIAFFEDRGVRQFLDTAPSAHSKVAELVRSYPIKSKNVVAHIRKATQGKVSLENTHPFMRELWGRYWIFAHNGTLVDFNPELDGSYLPVGNTDSEFVFCWIMQELRKQFGSVFPGTEKLFAALTELSKVAGDHGKFNFLLCNGSLLFAHCSTNLTYVLRKAPFPTVQLKDQDVTVDLSAQTTSEDRVAIIATSPLTHNEVWTDMKPGTLSLFEEGGISKTADTVVGVPRGLNY
ncbi:class II glutamine amidotransferase [Bdellovibrio reynosensis]|uniref:Class II glutamine amidotransferase n=1 Tax=Bdellovibrio reynosensis TaxID=2835041 RepID=A0ABY4C795_9BACT|nr:class II glutamine amidotransferase [Bdellovibrio reynosensis]UOF00848.1 class II glutamine amidotransferase [Bdellovibrio reynosensis]